ncbi:MAG: SDR family oxidoreductase [Burkholderiales bacterium]
MNANGYRSVFRPGLFTDQVAIVTGSGSGIGRCVAHELASLGAGVALIGRNEKKLQDVRAELKRSHAEVEYFVCDIRDEERVRTTVAGVLARFGRIDHLVNNAGGQYATPLEKISKKGWEAVVASNLTGGFLMARECYLQRMRDHGGAIVNMVADMWNGMPSMAHSGAARAGMVNMTMTAALEWASANVRVNAVAPGLVFSSGVDRYPPEVQEELLRHRSDIPLGRPGTEAEVASAIVFLLSEGAAYISGTTINIDGAFSMATPTYKLPPRKKPAPAYDGFHLSQPPALVANEQKAA